MSMVLESLCNENCTFIFLGTLLYKMNQIGSFFSISNTFELSIFTSYFYDIGIFFQKIKDHISQLKEKKMIRMI